MNLFHHRKPTTEEVKQISVATLREFKPLGKDQTSSATISWGGGPFDSLQSVSILLTPSQLLVAYNVPPDQSSATVQTTIPLTRTACHFGKDRLWFVCPGCGRRCGVLYWPDSDHILACRLCYGLGYESQRKTKSQRKLNRVFDVAFSSYSLLLRYRRPGPGRKPSLRKFVDKFCQ